MRTVIALGLVLLVVTLPGCVIVGHELWAATRMATTEVEKPDPDRFWAVESRPRLLPISESRAKEFARSAASEIGYELISDGDDASSIRSKVRAVPVPEYCDCGKYGSEIISEVADSTLVVTFSPRGENESTVAVTHTCNIIFHRRRAAFVGEHEEYACVTVGLIESEFWDALDHLLPREGGD